jgi:hypothetical protein
LFYSRKILSIKRLLLITKVHYFNSLAPIEAISFFSGFQKKRYSGKAGRLMAKKTPIIRSKKILKMLSRKGLRNTMEVFLCYLSLKY